MVGIPAVCGLCRRDFFSMNKLLAWLLCWDACPFVFWHGKLRVVQEFDARTRKIHCERCGKYFAMSDTHEAILPWDEEFEHFYGNILGHGRTLK